VRAHGFERETQETASNWSENGTGDERSAPDFVGAAKVRAGRKNSADPRHSPVDWQKKSCAESNEGATATEARVKFATMDPNPAKQIKRPRCG
jgi:hypothetical protein